MCDIVPVRGKKIIGTIVMGKSNTVISPSGYARSNYLQIRNIIKGLIGRSLDVFLRKRVMTIKKYLCNRGMTSFKRGMTICYILISIMSVTGTVRAECVPYPDMCIDFIRISRR